MMRKKMQGKKAHYTLTRGLLSYRAVAGMRQTKILASFFFVFVFVFSFLLFLSGIGKVKHCLIPRKKI